jgi:hypothetical protein
MTTFFVSILSSLILTPELRTKLLIFTSKNSPTGFTREIEKKFEIMEREKLSAERFTSLEKVTEISE